MKSFGLIFDLDGTLIDSREDLALSVNSLLSDLGYEPLSVEQIGTFIGDGTPKLAERSLRAVGELESMDDPRFPQLFEQLLHYYGENIANRSTVYPGVYEVLDQLHSHPMAVVTNKPAQFTRPVLETFDLDSYFSFTAGGDSYDRKKPDPFPLQEAMKALGVSPDRCIMTGDGDTDIKAGQAAGIYTIAAVYGYRPPEELQGLEPDFTINAFRDLLPIIERLETQHASEEVS